MADMEMLNRIARRQRGLITRVAGTRLRTHGRSDHEPATEWHVGSHPTRRLCGCRRAAVVGAVAARGHALGAGLRFTSDCGTPVAVARASTQPEQLEVVTSYDQHVRLDEVHGHRSRALFDVDRTTPQRASRQSPPSVRWSTFSGSMTTSSSAWCWTTRSDDGSLSSSRSDGAQVGSLPDRDDRCDACTTVLGLHASLATTRATATSRLGRSVSSLPPGFPPPRQQYRIRLRTKVAAHRPRLSRAEDRDRARLVGVPRQGQPHRLHGRPSDKQRSARDRVGADSFTADERRVLRRHDSPAVARRSVHARARHSAAV